jgi:hypothetical protein
MTSVYISQLVQTLLALLSNLFFTCFKPDDDGGILSVYF